MKNKPVFFIVLLLALFMAYAAAFGVTIPLGDDEITILGAPDMRFGIDIRGGVDAAFEPVGLDRKPTEDELEAARSIIEVRLDQNNIMDREVTIDTDNGYVIVRFPWKADETEFDPEQAMKELGETAKLTFTTENKDEVVVEGEHVKSSKPERHPSSPNEFIVSLVFDEEGTKQLSKATKELQGKIMKIYMDDTEIEAATVATHITGGECYIDGLATYEEAKDLSDKINSGALPFSMITKNHSTISPTLGSGALSIMVNAGLIAFCIISVLLMAYYRVPGVVACIALLMQISGQVLAMSMAQMTLTLDGIAGIILSIGMGVDANVIIAERISEEIKSGKSVESAIASGFKNAFSSVFDGNITVLIVAFILMVLGSGSLQSFAYTLFWGIVFNFVAGVTASRLMIKSLSSFKFLRKPKLYTCWSRRVVL